MRPLVSVIVATHDRPAMLETELVSILHSAARVRRNGIRTQVLVVDDASATMAARDVCARLGVDYIRRPVNGGVAATLAQGYEASDSEYTTFWGDDDYMLPRFLPRHLAEISRGYDVVAGSYFLADEDLKPIGTKYLRPVTMHRLLRGHVWANDGALLRRSALGGIRWRPERERAMLMTMWLALAYAGRRFTFIKEPTWLYRRHAGQLSANWDEHSLALRAEAIAEYTQVAA